MKYAFFGTPRFAAIILGRLLEADMPPSALVCNPDKPVGRKKVITPPPTKQLVLDIGNKEQRIKVLQPATSEELLAISDEVFENCDFGVVAAYAQIIPQAVIDKARLGIIGVHPSLLPKLRGASPIQAAILEGYDKTGVSLFMIDKDVDHGSVIAKRELAIGENDYTKLEKRLADISADLLLEVLPNFAIGKVELEIQDESSATYTQKYSTDDGYVDFNDLTEAENNGNGSETLLRKIRALNPEPGVYTFIGEKRTKLLDAEIKEGKLVLKEIQKEGGKPTKV
ncbi:MAG: hypothetical protein A3I33_01285 [Candidatus Colwellbacteria bacterium RIFCSPLOWO2_02_FULL_45_11]|uniref:methionyl-tRNA formyltransferase n=2 Tax=Parcubacteria group TaxID=1794811 RepID=A0A0H4T497_9BACT|nr:methionyl-tRNA formyltransferase, methionyl-tRNA formyltransferase [uncultured Parcubacteria bacterium Rifle_16ft_4_minimus_37647]OGY61108.1 MAG: hypothetical protein A3I33_01285 [Candidatus Colwellbacteria bacterium RIFCSPLOWO2_02_FULL_45_11]